MLSIARIYRTDQLTRSRVFSGVQGRTHKKIGGGGVFQTSGNCIEFNPIILQFRFFNN